MTYNISQDAMQAKHRPLTPNIIETAPFFTHPYAFTPHTQYSIYLNRPTNNKIAIEIQESTSMRHFHRLQIYPHEAN